MDQRDNRARVKDALDQGATYVQDQITRGNLDAQLSKYLKAGDFLLDLAWNIDANTILQWCHDHGVMYLNTSIEEWDPYVDGNVEKTAKEYGWNDRAQLFFIGTKHEAFHHFYFHKDSVIIDPFRYLKLKDDVKYIPIGICNQ